MLLGLAAASNTAAAAGASGTPEAEHPELLAMADRLPAVEQELCDAQVAVQAIFDEWNPRLPEPSDDLVW